ncbi:bacterial SH3 domain protein [Clostridium tepidiprofundi DSM 19306]|uniref:Bacterial SH3 domain protein n=1 Tax=Clostridium tepidiprofundi DSM 19306 TaxID=1121338 RepID=A0A151B2K0_9CLOT|nr:putative glycoside hydrolase [Clostridium tepidiprofundi]KYH33992.1 bacterial SH3 domain protein [Clostridium tepidiprofundi DSM 19306]
MTINKKLVAIVSTIFLSVSITACSTQKEALHQDKKILSQGATKNGENNTSKENADNKTDTQTGNDIKNDTELDDKTKTETETKTETNTETGKQSQTIVYINASKLRVRKEPTTTSKIITELPRGTKVKVIAEKSDAKKTKWLNITLADKVNDTNSIETGWVSSEYTVDNLSDLTRDDFSDLDFTAQNKVAEYEDNPRVQVKGIYVSAYSAASHIDDFIALAKKTGINAFVIDVKGDIGNMLFPTKAAEKYSPLANKRAVIKDINAFMKKLKDNNIYAIARIVSFKDPLYIKAHPNRAIVYRKNGRPFCNADGLMWATAYDRQLWEYNVAVAKEAAEVGFNEIQFDYVRFPASNGGKMDKLLDYRNTRKESKAKAIQEYLKYAYSQLSKKHVYIAADVYGLVGSVNDDMGLGQYWEGISNVVDYICPMMYPSHYGKGSYGLNIPDAHPYETVYHCTKDSVNKNNSIPTPAIVRPWIQDFTASWVRGHIHYGEKEVKAQIKALKDNGVNEFLLWNASNKYSVSSVK